MKILLLGAHGFIGSSILKALSEVEDFAVTCITRKQIHNVVDKDNVNWVQSDILSNKSCLKSVISGVDIVINAVGELEKSILMESVNFNLVKEIVDLMFKSRGYRKRLIQISSVGCYGAISHFKGKSILVTEDDAEYPIGLYEETKTKADSYIKETLSASNHCTYTILRPTNVFGLKMKSKAIFSLAFMIKKGRFFYISDRTAISTYVHVKDVAQAVKLICKELIKSSNQTYIVSDDCSQKVLVKTLADLFSVKTPSMAVPLIFVKFGMYLGKRFSSNFPLTESKINSLTSKVSFSNEKLVQLGFKPQFSIYNKKVTSSILRNWGLR